MKLYFKSSLAKNAGWMFVGQGLGYGLRLVYFIVIARLLGVLQYGIVVGAFALVNLVSEHSRLGSGMVLLRYVSPDRRRFAHYWGNTLFVTLCMSGVLILALRFIAPHVLDPRSAVIIVFLATGSCLCEQITISATQAFQAIQQMKLAAFLNQSTSLFRTIVAVVMWITLHHATARQWAVASMFASASATVVAVITVTIRVGWPKFIPLLAWKHAGEGAEYAFASSTTSAYNDLDKTMLSHYGMSAANGIYGMAYRILEMGAAPIVSIQLAAQPRLFELAATGPEAPIALGRKLLRNTLRVGTAASVIMFLFAPLIPMAAGRGFSEGVVALRWLCLIPIFRSVHSIAGTVLTSIGKQRYRTLTQLTAVALNFLLNLWLIPHYGWRGAAWSSLATDGSLGFLNWTVLEAVRRRQKNSKSAVKTTQAAQAAENAVRPSPLVSVVIPYYNQTAYIREAVLSAKRQTYPNVEIIVVDDGAPVPVAPILGDIEGIHIYRKDNGGASAARNYGFQESRGEYLLFLDADDRLVPEAIETHMAALGQNPSAGLSFGSTRIIDEDDRELRPPHICRSRNDYFRMLLVSNPIECPGGALIRRRAFVDAGLFDPSFRNAEDYHLYLRLARRYSLARHEECVVEYRKHSGGKSQDKERMISAVMKILEDIESRCELDSAERRKLQHGRRRWTHVMRPERTLDYRIKDLYYSFCAMLTVPIRSYFSERG